MAVRACEVATILNPWRKIQGPRPRQETTLRSISTPDLDRLAPEGHIRDRETLTMAKPKNPLAALYEPPAYERVPPLTAEQRLVARRLIGKRIKTVRLRPFHPGIHHAETAATNPEIIFHDGSILRFVTQETESGEYGTSLVYLCRASLKPSGCDNCQHELNDSNRSDDDDTMCQFCVDRLDAEAAGEEGK